VAFGTPRSLQWPGSIKGLQRSIILPHCTIDYKKKIVYFWSPKVACTAFTDWFYFEYLKLAEWSEDKTFARASLAAMGYSTHYETGCQLCMNLGFTSVALVRHPATRSLSAFINKFVNYQGTSLDSFDKLEGFARNFAAEIYKYNKWDISQYSGISFREYLDFIKLKVDRNPDRPQLNNHWSIQSAPDFSKRGFRYNYILKLEDMEYTQRVISDLSGMDVKFRRSNESVYGQGVGRDLSTLRSLNLLPEYRKFSRGDFLTDSVLDYINQIYAADMSAFGYAIKLP